MFVMADGVYSPIYVWAASLVVSLHDHPYYLLAVNPAAFQATGVGYLMRLPMTGERRFRF